MTRGRTSGPLVKQKKDMANSYNITERDIALHQARHGKQRGTAADTCATQRQPSQQRPAAALNTVWIDVPIDPGEASPNRRLHWRTLHRIKQAHKEAARFAWLQSGIPQFQCKVSVRIVVYRARRIDPDNCLAGLKATIDGLFNGALTHNDSDRCVEFWPVKQDTGKRYASRPYVRFWVEPVEQ